MLGKRDFLSIKKSKHIQKRLLLLYLNELHFAFKKDLMSRPVCQSFAI